MKIEIVEMEDRKAKFILKDSAEFVTKLKSLKK